MTNGEQTTKPENRNASRPPRLFLGFGLGAFAIWTSSWDMND